MVSKALLTSSSQEHYTPYWLLAEVVQFFGGEISLDPACMPNNSHGVPTLRYYTKKDNGLSRPWQGKVYLNPPYKTTLQRKFLLKAVKEYKRGNTEETLILVPARTDTANFEIMSQYLRCYLKGRLIFEGSIDPAPFPSVLYYLGNDPLSFVHFWCKFGVIQCTLTAQTDQLIPLFPMKASNI